MEYKDLPDIVKEWMEIIRVSSSSDVDRMNEYCEKLNAYAEETNSIFLKGFCIFYRGFNKYLSAELDTAMALLTEALKYLSMAERWRMAAHCYNAMGNIAAFQGDTSLAIDCYIKCLSMARTHNAKEVEYNVCSNIANVHMSLNDPENAVEMLNASEKLVEEGLEVPDDQRAVVFANLAVCYTQLNELEKAEGYLNRLRNSMSETPTVMNQIIICILETQLYNRTGDIGTRDAAIARLNALPLRSMEVYDALHELHSHAQLLLEIGKFDEFTVLIDRINELADSPTVKRHSLDLRMKYAKITGDMDTYAQLAMVYYDIAQQREEERNRIASHNMTTRIRLDEEEARRKEAEKSNLVLKERSEHDALTGLNNRYKLNELSEEAFQRAYLSGKPLTVEILDIDCYKKFNDNYGHQAGDDCLIKIANAIRTMEEYPRVHTGRYGGDEFVLVYEEYSKEEIEELAATLRQKITDLNIEHKYSTVCDHITISQGLFHGVPVAGNKLWDFMYSADMALYIVKRKSKNNFHVASNFAEVRDEYQALTSK